MISGVIYFVWVFTSNSALAGFWDRMPFDWNLYRFCCQSLFILFSYSFEVPVVHSLTCEYVSLYVFYTPMDLCVCGFWFEANIKLTTYTCAWNETYNSKIYYIQNNDRMRWYYYSSFIVYRTYAHSDAEKFMELNCWICVSILNRHFWYED